MQCHKRHQRIDNLTFCYNGLEVTSDISFALKRGDYLGIAGPNGSVKARLLKNILGILQPQKGVVNIFGQPLTFFSSMNRWLSAQRISALNNTSQHCRRDRSIGNEEKNTTAFKTHSEADGNRAPCRTPDR